MKFFFFSACELFGIQGMCKLNTFVVKLQQLLSVRSKWNNNLKLNVVHFYQTQLNVIVVIV